MTLLIKLLLAHFIGDFLFQPKAWIADKQEKKWKSTKLYWHILLHLALLFAILFDLKYWMGILIIALTHLIIDIAKVTYQKESNRQLFFIGDQFLHLFIIVMVSQYYTSFTTEVFGAMNWNNLLLLILAILLVTKVSSITIKVLISKWTPENEDKEEDSLSNAGSTIGMLERLFVFGFMISGNLGAIGFLLAAKSVFRFGDLKEAKDRKLTEYILIGTLLSFGLAILIGIFYLKLKKAIEAP